MRRVVRLLVALILLLAATHGGWSSAAQRLPASLTDDEFWRMVTEFSERPGTFPSDNLVSNERQLQSVIPELLTRATRGGVYLGVGPEQNFSYIAAVQPAMAFIFDIRRGNLDLHLLYKALFELSSDRRDFVARLFCRSPPARLGSGDTIADIFDAVARSESSESAYVEHMRAVVNLLVKKHGYALAADDLLRLQHTYRAFCTFGPEIQYSSTRTVGPANRGRRLAEPSYRDLMLATDGEGHERSYLASAESFALIKQLEMENRIVPVIGNFAGPRAVRAVAAYLRSQNVLVSTFYLSNVEEYLRRDGTLQAFCDNAEALPTDETGVFIRSIRTVEADSGFALTSELGGMAADTKSCR
jgi:hypothetical protein